jgi:hypothetical protein
MKHELYMKRNTNRELYSVHKYMAYVKYDKKNEWWDSIWSGSVNDFCEIIM